MGGRPFLAAPGALKSMAEIYLGVQMTHIEELIGKGKNQVTMAEVEIAAAAQYAAADAECTLRLLPLMEKKLEKVTGARLFADIEMPLIPVLAQMRNKTALPWTCLLF